MTNESLPVRVFSNFPQVKYTDYPQPEVEELVSNHIDRIVNTVVEQISPKAIVLTGSFGRGEGSVLFDHGQLRVLSDYEVAVVTWKALKRQHIIRLSDTLSKELDADVSLFWATPGRVKYNRMKNLSFGTAKPTRFMYDFKVGSVLLYGNLNLRENQLLPKNLPAWEGLRLVFNRLGEFLFQVDKKGFQQWVSGQNSGQSLAIPKSLLSAMNGFLVASGEYRPSIKERLSIFLNQPPSYIDLTGLSEILKNAVESRIHGAPWQGIPWKIYRRFVLDSLEFLLDKTFAFQFTNLVDFPKEFFPNRKSQEAIIQYEAGWLPLKPFTFENCIQRIKLQRAGLRNEIRRFKSKGLLPSLVIQSLIPGMVLLTNEGSLGGIFKGFQQSSLDFNDLVLQYRDEWELWDSLRCVLHPLWKAIC
jgi:hypothetical protein